MWILAIVLSQKYQLRAIWKQEKRSNTTTEPTSNLVNVVIKAKIAVNRNTQIISNRYSTNLYLLSYTSRDVIVRSNSCINNKGLKSLNVSFD